MSKIDTESFSNLFVVTVAHTTMHIIDNYVHFFDLHAGDVFVKIRKISHEEVKKFGLIEHNRYWCYFPKFSIYLLITDYKLENLCVKL